MLAELLGSKLRAKIIGWLFTHPDERYFVRQLQGLIGGDSTNISRELARLEALGLLRSKSEGRQKYYQANSDSPIFEELCGLAVKTIGLADVLRAALAPMARKIDLAFVYGSQASGQAKSGSDVDLLVVGDADDLALHGAVSQAEKQLGRSVNYTLLSQRELKKRRREKGGFLARILAGPKLILIGQADEI
jgi:predicted nucleotidyltransferase